ncbi:hypothetical protein NC652_013864 [Populus alba x Populus x berolinensis]|nr:hypothetical protein NC652_013864 [Populus alba x Populus x berolinensis]
MENRWSKWATNQELKSFRISCFILHHNHESLVSARGSQLLVHPISSAKQAQIASHDSPQAPCYEQISNK